MGGWSGRAMALGTTGFAAAVTLLMVLAPASAGVVPAKVLTAPYLHTVSQSSTFSGASGCAKGTATKPAWHPLTGVISAADSGSAKACGKNLGFVGGSSYSDAQSSEEIAIPFSVGSNGNHAITTSVSTSSALSATFTTSGCPAKKINFNPPLGASSYAYCESFTFAEFEVFGQMQDLDNSSWFSYNFSYVFAYNESGWENFTSCFNSGTPSCSNTTGPINFQAGFGFNSAGASSFMLNGASSISLWTNGTNMVKGHHYVLILEVFTFFEAAVALANLATTWTATTAGSLNMATLGNGATISSVSIL